MRPTPKTNSAEATVTLRLSRPDDAAGLTRLAHRDSASLPGGRLLVAEVGEELLAAVTLDGSASIADPFHHTADLVRLLQVQRREILRASRAGRRFGVPPRRQFRVAGL
jgi:hypothetical protein